MRELVDRWRSKRQDGLRGAIFGLGRDLPRIFVRHSYFLYFRYSLANKATSDVGEIVKIYVDPLEIKWVAMLSEPLVQRYGPRAVVGTVPGSWDRFRIPIESTKTYKMLSSVWRARGRNHLLDSMADGYRETFVPRKDIRGIKLPDEVRLAVGRDNSLIRWSGGLHRIAAAQLLGIKRIPAYLIIWHSHADRQKLLDKYGNEISSLASQSSHGPASAAYPES